MKKFLKNIVLFFFLTLIVGEVVVRSTHVMADIPQRTINKQGIQKYFPNQSGYWKGGNHKWLINRLGWPGILPKSFDNLVIVIGDSFIENFMNPNECHQSIFLKENMANYNFMETARSGVSLIEAMEISKQNDSLNPVHTLIYVNDYDFYESIVEVNPMRDITQISIKDFNIKHGEMKAPAFKKVLYNWKLLYYFYVRFPLNTNSEKVENPEKIEKSKVNQIKSKEEVFKLIGFISKNYEIKDKTLVFHPKSNQVIIEECKNMGFNVIELDSSNDKTWSFDYDNHWTCYGHEKAAKQVSQRLSKTLTTIQQE